MNLNHLTDKTLLNDSKILIAQERSCLTKVLYHLREIETRRLFAELKYGSLFEYAVKELGYSEAAAKRRKLLQDSVRQQKSNRERTSRE